MKKIALNIAYQFLKAGYMLFFYVTLSGCLPANAQSNWVTQLGGTENDIGVCTAADASGNIYTIGTFSGTASFGIYNIISAGKGDIFVTKASASDGDVQWVKQIGAMNEDNGNSIVCDPAGNVYVTGRFSGSLTLGSSTLSASGASDAFIARIDNATGSIAWARRIGGTGNDGGLSITCDQTGNIYASGYFQGYAVFGTFTLSPTGTNHNVFVARIDGATGNIVWAKGYGSSGYSYGNSISCDASGDVYLTGSFESSVILGTHTLSSVQYQDVFISKHYASTGNVAWAQSIGGSLNDYATGITVNADGFVYCTGKFESVCNFGTFTLTSNGNADIFIAKLNASTGVFDWAKQFGDEGHEQANAITHDAAGYIFITGQFNGYVTFDEHLINSAGNSDGFIVKVDGLTGKAVWASPLGGISIDSGYGISTDNNGGLYCTGAFQSTAFLAGPNYSTRGNSDVFVIKLQSATVGSDEKINSESSLKVWPVPFQNELDVSLTKPNLNAYTLLLKYFTGKLIFQIHSQEPRHHFDLEFLNPGIYFLSITGKNGFSATKKIVKN